MEHTTVTKKPSGWQKYDSPSYEKLPSGTHNTINILLTGRLPVLGEYSVEVAVQTVNLLPSGSSGSTPLSPIHRVEKRNLTRLISLRTAVRIRLLQLNPLRVKLFVYRQSMTQVDLRMSVNVQLTRRLRKKLFREMRPRAVRSDSRQF